MLDGIQIFKSADSGGDQDGDGQGGAEAGPSRPGEGGASAHEGQVGGM